MKIGIISDIHANLEALNEVLLRIKKEEVVSIFCLGDFVGIGASPNEVIEAISKVENLVAVVGDYDEAVISGETKGFDRLSKKSIEWTRGKLAEVNLGFLKSLKKIEGRLVDGRNLLLFHYGPINHLVGPIHEETTVEELRRYLRNVRADAILFGHTHIPFKLEIDGKIVLNPGSVGYSKDGDNRASYAILEIKDGKILVEIKRVKYEIGEEIKKMVEIGLTELGRRLNEAW